VELQLLVDAAEFKERVADDVAGARRSVYVQALSFEGDGAGRFIADLLAAAPAPDRRVVVDAFSRHVLSDRFRWAPRHLISRPVWTEARDTQRMYAGLRRAGVGLRFTGPVGLFFWRFPARNHKKLVAVDGRVVYLGGINFSDHNFAWHDLMLRIEEPRLARFLEQDFLATWSGVHRAGSLALPGLELHALDGNGNRAVFASVLDLLDGARDEIFLECPYVTPPFSRRLEQAARRGVRVVVVTPERHNWPLVRDALLCQAARSPLQVRLYPDRMTHVKALLVDGRRLVLGSANFDLWSYRWQQEYLAVITDPAAVAAFRTRVAEPDQACSMPAVGPSRVSAGIAARMAILSLFASPGRAARPAPARARATLTVPEEGP
jgi:cardiolipin synthase